MAMAGFDFEELANKWESAVVARSEIGRFTGGAMTPGYLANLDSAKIGPPRLRIGRKVVYPVRSLVEWMESRAEAV